MKSRSSLNESIFVFFCVLSWLATGGKLGQGIMVLCSIWCFDFSGELLRVEYSVDIPSDAPLAAVMTTGYVVDDVNIIQAGIVENTRRTEYRDFRYFLF